MASPDTWYDLMGGPRPDDNDIMGGPKPDTPETDVLGGPDDAGPSGDVLGGADDAGPDADILGGPGAETDVLSSGGGFRRRLMDGLSRLLGGAPR
ncbi:MAG TPA: hypothetical protein VEV63_17650 [Streptosporangiaceae bacterium]|nr:hypothetical protein [Streptosporangiaceae bacterium]